MTWLCSYGGPELAWWALWPELTKIGHFANHRKVVTCPGRLSRTRLTLPYRDTLRERFAQRRSRGLGNGMETGMALIQARFLLKFVFGASTVALI